MKLSELRELTIEELYSELHRLREELFSLRFKHKTQRTSNPLRLRTARRDVARILTIINEKEIRRQSSI